MNSISLRFTNEVGKDSPYYKGFKFFKDIILDLKEDSDLIFIYLQINSGCGLDLISGEKYFKISMVSVEDIKSHIIENIPKYFYTHSSNREHYIATDPRTQIMSFNEDKIFDYTNNTDDKIKTEKNNIMNITIVLFHESGQAKFHKNIEIGGARTPINCINKKFEFTKKYHYEDKSRGESGKFIDHFLYDSNKDEIVIELINSKRTNELMDKNNFIGSLEHLKIEANNILSSEQAKNSQIINNNNKSDGLSHLSSKFQSNMESDQEYKRLREIGCDVDY